MTTPRFTEHFAGRTVVATGTASGIGAAVLAALLEAGAEVYALDRTYDQQTTEPSTGDRPTLLHCDIGSAPSIDAALGELPRQIDVLLNCAGVPNGGRFSPEEVMRVNWLGLRYLTESVISRMPSGSSIVHIASTAGRAWSDRVATHEALMKASGFDDGLGWVGENLGDVGDGYVLSKEAVQYYTMWRATQLLPSGIRMNSVCPGITDTAIIADFRRGIGDAAIDHAAAVAGRFARPEEMAPAMLFLADEASASYINGVNLNIDRGTAAARLTDQADPATIWSG